MLALGFSVFAPVALGPLGDPMHFCTLICDGQRASQDSTASTNFFGSNGFIKKMVRSGT